MFKTSIGIVVAIAAFWLWSGAGLTQQRTPPKNKTDLDRLQGLWKVVTSKSGKHTSGGENAFLIVHGNRACLQCDEGEISGGIYIDIKSELKSLDFATSPWTRQCIFALDGNTLLLCYDLAQEAKRPTDFSVGPESQRVLFVLQKLHDGGQIVLPFRRPDGSPRWPSLAELRQMDKQQANLDAGNRLN